MLGSPCKRNLHRSLGFLDHFFDMQTSGYYACCQRFSAIVERLTIWRLLVIFTLTTTPWRDYRPKVYHAPLAYIIDTAL